MIDLTRYTESEILMLVATKVITKEEAAAYWQKLTNSSKVS